jgi:hypothetical protein
MRNTAIAVVRACLQAYVDKDRGQSRSCSTMTTTTLPRTPRRPTRCPPWQGGEQHLARSPHDAGLADAPHDHRAEQYRQHPRDGEKTHPGSLTRCSAAAPITAVGRIP